MDNNKSEVSLRQTLALVSNNHLYGILETMCFLIKTKSDIAFLSCLKEGRILLFICCLFVVYLLFIAAVNSKKSLEAAKSKTLKNRIDKPFFEDCKKLPKAPVGSRKA